MYINHYMLKIISDNYKTRSFLIISISRLFINANFAYSAAVSRSSGKQVNQVSMISFRLLSKQEMSGYLWVKYNYEYKEPISAL